MATRVAAGCRAPHFLASAVIALSAPLFAPVARAAPEQRSKPTLLDRAFDDFRAGRYAAALASFDAELGKAPTRGAHAKIAYNAAVCSYALGQYADALRRFEAVSDLAPELRALARVNAGFAALHLGDLERAARLAEPSTDLDADTERKRKELSTEIETARASIRAKQRDAAIETGFGALARQNWSLADGELTRALALTTVHDAENLADIHYGLGLAALEQQNGAAAAEHFRASLAERPRDPRALLALGRAAEANADPNGAELAYTSGSRLPVPPEAAEPFHESLSRLYRLPSTGPIVGASVAMGHDDNATQSGSTDVIGGSSATKTASAYVSSAVDLGLTLRASSQHAVGIHYSGELLAFLDPVVEPLSLQVHEVAGRWQWAPRVGLRLALDAGVAHVLTGLEPITSLQSEGVMGLRLDLDTSRRSRLRLRLGERLVPASELAYLEGHRLDASATQTWWLGAWELSALASFQYHAAGTQELELAPDAFAACGPDCGDQRYQNPLGYASPGLGASVAWQTFRRLRVSLLGRADYRHYVDEAGIAGIVVSQKHREDWRLRARAGAECTLDDAGTIRITLDQSALASLSNVAFDPGDIEHQYDYGDRNFVQLTTELGVAAAFF
jgi:tetratricopeptide (TPR) repeat protein